MGRDYRERVRLFEPDQMSSMLSSAGVDLRFRFGDYEGSALVPDSPRTIFLGQVG